MAKITVENATVQRTFQTAYGVGVSVFETFKRRDETEGKNYFTCWFKEDPGLVEGQVVSVSGLHGVKVREYDANGQTRHSADVSLNSARLTSASEPAASDEPWAAAPEPTWALPPVDEEEPF